ncbi:DUF2157 domain-containing protein [Terriglobus sp. TAA 43]|uniref:DUF2157 domain-containing protein n=1 Tax=Terriglobus sp. TAA 43 TaxID=278961 RepID=UPI0006915520|nr:DUF2157 domain-containing protein [Terriglobus sp. TAA 43]
MVPPLFRLLDLSCNAPLAALMMQDIETKLAEWSAAGVIDSATAQRIRAWEEEHASRTARPEAQRWQVRLALIFGAVLLSAGILLFVAAHWDNIGPGFRLLLIMGTLVGLHGAAIAVRERFAALATALHAIGTVALGGAIALSGQIFNIESHWPNAILMWALGAAAGWWLLRDAPQKTLTLLLVPAWALCELGDRMQPYEGGNVYLSRLALLVGAVYLLRYLAEPVRAVGNWLFAVGALAIPVSVGILADGWQYRYVFFTRGYSSFVPLRYRALWLLLVIGLMAWGWLRSREAFPVIAGAVAVGIALPWLVRPVSHGVVDLGNPWSRPYVTWEPSVFSYLLLALAAAALAWWGVRHKARGVVNYATVAFGVVVLWFYFSDLMDKLDRSLGLIGLGVLFLAGGYVLERLRRRLLLQMTEEAA